MKYFYDTEFIESGPEVPIRLISIGIVCEDGREFYAQNAACPLHIASGWVRENVFPHLKGLSKVVNGSYVRQMSEWLSPSQIASGIRAFVGDDKPEFWGYYSAYDHVVLCQLFGTMMELPKGFPMYTRDLKQWCDALGNPKLPEQGKGEHHALADARWNMKVYQFLKSLEDGEGMPVQIIPNYANA